MSTEDLSSEELGELQQQLLQCAIEPTLPLIKLLDSQLPLTLNPFYDAGIQTQIISEPFAQEQHKRPPNCRRCRLRRRSESVLDDYNKVTATKGSEDAGTSSCHSRSVPRLLRTTLKKSSPTTGGRKLLREPVLRALQTCLQPQSCTTRKLLACCVDEKTGTAVANVPPAEEQSRGISDFRDLIQECDVLLKQDVSFSDRLQQRNFTTMRNPKGGPKMQRKQRRLTDAGGGQLSSGGPNCSPLPTATAARLSSSSSSTCSQQAGSATPVGTTSNDDVTIDELASYFDTFVHIPKKMSTMAEMMYI